MPQKRLGLDGTDCDYMEALVSKSSEIHAAVTGLFDLITQIEKKRTSIFIGVYSCATVITSLLIAPVLQLGLIYLFLALIFGIYLMIKSYGLYSDKIKPISYFVFSNTYLAVIFLSMIADILFTIRNT